ncbi:hypothetical protein D3C86_1154580 [compost metagenome]
MVGRLLEDRPQQRVVADRHRAIAVARFKGVQLVLHAFEVDQRIGGVGRRFHIEDAHRPLGRRRLQRRAHGLGRQAVADGMRADAPFRKHLGDQRLGATVQGQRLHQLVAGAQERHQHGADGGHAAGRDRRRLGPIQQGQPVFDDFQVGMIEAAVDQPGRFPLRQGLAARHHVKEGRAVLGGPERERRRQEDGRLDRAFGQKGVIAIGHHLRFRMQRASKNILLVISRIRHGVPLTLGFQPTGQARIACCDDNAYSSACIWPGTTRLRPLRLAW